MSIKQRFTEQEIEEHLRGEVLEILRELGVEQTLEYVKDYGDLFVLEGEDVGTSVPHIAALKHLIPLLEWLFHDQDTAVVPDFRFYRTGIEGSMVSPDISIVDGFVIETTNASKTYEVGVDGPPPRVVFEAASESTWRHDVVNKVSSYRLLGVKEYFTFDSHPEQVWKGKWLARGRLIGWRLNPSGQYDELALDEQGRLESKELAVWLKVENEAQPDEAYKFRLRLFDRNGRLIQNETQHERELRLQAQSQAETQAAHTVQVENALQEERTRAEQAENALQAERNRTTAANQRLAELEAQLEQFRNQAH